MPDNSVLQERLAPAYVHSMSGQGQALQFAELAWELARSQISVRYRRSMLGILWALLQPLGYLLVFLFLRGVFGASSDGAPFALTGYCGLVLWAFFSNAVANSASSVIKNRGVVKKVAIKREVFPASTLLVSLVDLFIASVLLAGMLIFFASSGRFEPDVGWALLWVPVIVFLTGMFAFGIGMLAAAIGTYKDDLIIAMPFIMQFWLLATPLLYRLDEVPERWQVLFSMNPMVGLVESFRAAVLHSAPPDPHALGLSVLGIGLVWLIAWPIFAKASQSFADVL